MGNSQWRSNLRQNIRSTHVSPKNMTTRLWKSKRESIRLWNNRAQPRNRKFQNKRRLRNHKWWWKRLSLSLCSKGRWCFSMSQLWCRLSRDKVLIMSKFSGKLTRNKCLTMTRASSKRVTLINHSKQMKLYIKKSSVKSSMEDHLGSLLQMRDQRISIASKRALGTRSES